MNQKIFDSEGVMTRLDNDRELLFELVEIFLSEYESQLADIESAISENAHKALQESAHAIKGALGNVGAMLAHNYAFQLEQAGRSEDLSGIQDTFPKFKTAISDYIKEVNQFRTNT